MVECGSVVSGGVRLAVKRHMTLVGYQHKVT